MQIGKEFAAAEVGIAVGVTAGTTEGAFARDLDGKHGRFAGQDFSPRAQYLSRGNAWIWTSSGHVTWMQTSVLQDTSILRSDIAEILSNSSIGCIWRKLSSRLLTWSFPPIRHARMFAGPLTVAAKTRAANWVNLLRVLRLSLQFRDHPFLTLR